MAADSTEPTIPVVPFELSPFQGRLLSLDLLRFLAVFGVIGRHLEAPPPDFHPLLRAFVEMWQCGGWVGVDLFFVLSGFLVSSLLFREYQARGKIDPWRFYLRRGFKIYPAYYALMALSLILIWLYELPVNASAILSELLFLRSYLPGFWSHTWSVSVEEHFYLVLPWLLLLFFRWHGPLPIPRRRWMLVAITLGVSILVWRILSFQEGLESDILFSLYSTHLRIDALGFGVLLSYAYHFFPGEFAQLRRFRGGLLFLGFLGLVPAFLFEVMHSPWIVTFGLTVFYLASAMILVGALHFEIPSKGPLFWAARLGGYSYSTYLWHLPVIQLFWPVLDRWQLPITYGWELLTLLVMIFCLGVISARAIEFPLLRLRDRCFPSRSATPSLP